MSKIHTFLRFTLASNLTPCPGMSPIPALILGAIHPVGCASRWSSQCRRLQGRSGSPQTPTEAKLPSRYHKHVGFCRGSERRKANISSETEPWAPT